MGLDMFFFQMNKDYAINSMNAEIKLLQYRKVNQIHGWIEKNCTRIHDTESIYEVSKDELNELIVICAKVVHDKEWAESLLPRCDGFFFGPQEYDENYFETTKDVAEDLIEVRDTFDFENKSLVYASWW